MIEMIRPQIILAMVIIGIVSCIAIFIGQQMASKEIVIGALVGATTTLGPLAMKILEKD